MSKSVEILESVAKLTTCGKFVASVSGVENFILDFEFGSNSTLSLKARQTFYEDLHKRMERFNPVSEGDYVLGTLLGNIECKVRYAKTFLYLEINSPDKAESQEPSVAISKTFEFFIWLLPSIAKEELLSTLEPDYCRAVECFGKRLANVGLFLKLLGVNVTICFTWLIRYPGQLVALVLHGKKDSEEGKPAKK